MELRDGTSSDQELADSRSRAGLGVAGIVGVTLGIFFFLLLLALCCLVCFRRERRRTERSDAITIAALRSNAVAAAQDNRNAASSEPVGASATPSDPTGGIGGFYAPARPAAASPPARPDGTGGVRGFYEADQREGRLMNEGVTPAPAPRANRTAENQAMGKYL